MSCPGCARTSSRSGSRRCVNTAVPFVLIPLGQTKIDSGTAAILNAAAPLFTVLFAAVAMHSERVTGLSLAGFLLGFAGVVLVVGAEPGEGTGPVLGALAVVLAAAFYAVGALFTSSRLRGLSALEIALGTMTWATLLTLPPGLVALRGHEVGWGLAPRCSRSAWSRRGSRTSCTSA